jgi:hypothetical protein
MKKKIYVLLFALVSTFVVSSCADEEVTPRTEQTGTTGNGGGSQDPIKN